MAAEQGFASHFLVPSNEVCSQGKDEELYFSHNCLGTHANRRLMIPQCTLYDTVKDILLYLQQEPLITLIREVSPSNEWKLMQRPTAKH